MSWVVKESPKCLTTSPMTNIMWNLQQKSVLGDKGLDNEMISRNSATENTANSSVVQEPKKIKPDHTWSEIPVINRSVLHALLRICGKPVWLPYLIPTKKQHIWVNKFDRLASRSIFITITFPLYWERLWIRHNLDLHLLKMTHLKKKVAVQGQILLLGVIVDLFSLLVQIPLYYIEHNGLNHGLSESVLHH